MAKPLAFMKSLFLGATIAVTGCGAPSASSYSTHVDSLGGPVLNMTVKITGGARNGELVVVSGKAVQKIAGDIVGGRSPTSAPFETLNLTVVAPDVRQTNDGVGAKILHLSFDVQILRRSFHAGADGDTLLSLASDVGWWTPSNDDVMAAYCLDHSAGQFCQRIKDDLG